MLIRQESFMWRAGDLDQEHLECIAEKYHERSGMEAKIMARQGPPAYALNVSRGNTTPT